MYTGLKHAHYTLMILLIILLLYTAARFFFNAMNGKKFGKFEDKQSLITLILAHTQLLLGLGLYFSGPWLDAWSAEGAMKNAATRLIILEHPLTMMIGIVLITVGRAKAKRIVEDQKKFKTTAIFYAIALVLILARIPWANITNG